MAHARPFAFEEAPIVHAPSMYRFGHGTPTIPGYVVAQPGHAMISSIGVPQNSRAQRASHPRITAMALERGLRVNSPLDPAQRTGWIGIDFGGAEEACRRLIEHRVFVDYRPGCGIRVGPHFYTTEVEIDEFFKTLESVTSRTATVSS